MQVVRSGVRLTLEGAKRLLDGAERRAGELGVPMDIAVVDDGGNLLVFHRMDGAKITSIDIAINKAFTAAGARKATHEYGVVAQPGGPAFGIHASNQGRFVIFGGGLPVFAEGQIVGGIGVSSGTPDEDREVAQAGIEALQDLLQSGPAKA